MSIEATRVVLNENDQNLTLKEISTVLESQQILQEFYGNKIFMHSMKPDERIEFINQHCVFNGFVQAYKEHRPITISPDIIWLLIIQGFANHVNNNSEKLRSMFVDFEGQKHLTVRRTNITPKTATIKDWDKIFSEFVGQISGFTGPEIAETLEPAFTTTTDITRAVGDLSIMCAMKKYFTYEVMMCICHFPFIVVEGTVEDWEKIANKLEKIRKFELDFWVDTLLPIISKIIDTKKGNVDQKFWNDMIHIQPKRGPYNPGYVDGWFVNFFLYDIYGDKIGGRVGDKRKDELTSEMLTIPFVLTVDDGVSSCSTDCEFVAGFVGVSQDPNTKSIKPEIGWIIREEDKEQKEKDRLEIERLREEAEREGDAYIRESK